MYKKRLTTFATILSLLVVFDAVKALTLGGPAILNWHSFVHPFWVIVAAALYFAGVKINAKWFWNVLLTVYSVTFIAALANQYAPFTDILTYNCMLFNLIFVPLYLFLGASDIGQAPKQAVPGTFTDQKLELF
jgi:hypothetical protein